VPAFSAPVARARRVLPPGLAVPRLASWPPPANLAFMLLLGGFDPFFGPVLGAVVFILLQAQVMSLTSYWRFVFGAILAVVVIFSPRGLMGLLDPRRGPPPCRCWRRWRWGSCSGTTARVTH